MSSSPKIPMGENPSQLNPSDPTGIKSCCTALYSSDWARLILGESFHPGGLSLTETLGRALDIPPGAKLIDVASGEGTSGLHLAEILECRINGYDLSPDLVKRANIDAVRRGLEGQVAFHLGDAESLPSPSMAADAVICECAFCTFPDKASAAHEFYRVLKPGGRFGLSDITRATSLPPDLETLLAWVACIADAQPIESTLLILENAGFAIIDVQNHDPALAQMVGGIKRRLITAELLLKLSNVSLPEIDLDEAKRLARAAEKAVQEGKLGYSIVLAEKPA